MHIKLACAQRTYIYVSCRKLTPASVHAHALLAREHIHVGEPVVVYGGECWLDKDLQEHEEHADDEEAREVCMIWRCSACQGDCEQHSSDQ